MSIQFNLGLEQPHKIIWLTEEAMRLSITPEQLVQRAQRVMAPYQAQTAQDCAFQVRVTWWRSLARAAQSWHQRSLEEATTRGGSAYEARQAARLTTSQLDSLLRKELEYVNPRDFMPYFGGFMFRISADDWHSLLEHVIAASPPSIVFQLIAYLWNAHEWPFSQLIATYSHAAMSKRPVSARLINQGPLVSFALVFTRLMDALDENDHHRISVAVDELGAWLQAYTHCVHQRRFLKPALIVSLGELWGAVSHLNPKHLKYNINSALGADNERRNLILKHMDRITTQHLASDSVSPITETFWVPPTHNSIPPHLQDHFGDQ